MKTRFLFVVISISLIIASSCKKDKTIEVKAELTPEVLEDVSDKTTAIFADLQSFMSNALVKAMESGVDITTPPSQSSASAEMSNISILKGAKDFEWLGPDGEGWYYRTWDGIYKYTEKIRCQDTILTHILKTEYNGGDGSYSNVWETQYAKYTKNNKVLWKGYSDWKISSLGDNNISDLQWRFEFKDWDPQTGAGTYDWYWGAQSLGGGYEPYHRFLNLIATAGSNDLLHVKITWYDGNVQVGSYEYDTNWEPVEMPEMPCDGL